MSQNSVLHTPATHIHRLVYHAKDLPRPIEDMGTWHGMYHMCPIFWIGVAVLISSIMASFYGVLVFRLPSIFRITFTEYARTRTDRTLMDRSHCDSCDRTLNFVDLIPVLGWIIRCGRCPDCGSKIPIVYPVMEGLAGLIAGVLVWGSGGNFILPAIFSWLFLVSWLDDRTQWLPMGMWVPIMMTAFLLPVLGWTPVSLSSAVIGFVLGWLLLFSVFGVFSLLRKEDLMNYADVWLFASLLALVGYEASPLFVGGTAILTVPYIIFMKLREKHAGVEMEFVNGQADSISSSDLRPKSDMFPEDVIIDVSDTKKSEHLEEIEWSLGIPMAPLMCVCAMILLSMEFFREMPFSLPG